MTSEIVEPEVKTTYEYVLDLKERLSDTCELAQKELHRAQTSQAKYYNRSTKDFFFKQETKFLFCYQPSQTSCCYHCLCSVQFLKGPFKVIERIRGNDYKIQLVGRTKTFHAIC